MKNITIFHLKIIIITAMKYHSILHGHVCVMSWSSPGQDVHCLPYCLRLLGAFLHRMDNMSLVMRKPAFCICENKDADQLCGNCEADQRLCFHYADSTIPLLPKSEISSLQLSSVAVQPGLCRTWSETPKTGFLITRLIMLVEQYFGCLQILSII